MRRSAAVVAALVLSAITACACKGRTGTGPGNGNGTGTGGGTGSAESDACVAITAPVEALYQAEAAAAPAGTQPDSFVADNVAMVMRDCARDPGKVAPCAARAKTVAELEAQCLIPLDDEGTEGLDLAK